MLLCKVQIKNRPSTVHSCYNSRACIVFEPNQCLILDLGAPGAPLPPSFLPSFGLGVSQYLGLWSLPIPWDWEATDILGLGDFNYLWLEASQYLGFGSLPISWGGAFQYLGFGSLPMGGRSRVGPRGFMWGPGW